jgi:hypothetical protein
MKLLKLTLIFILLWFGIYFLTTLLIVLIFQQHYTDVVTNPFLIVMGGIVDVAITGAIVDTLNDELK